MTIRVLCVGKVKERFYRDAADELLKRLGRYGEVGLIEVADEKAPEWLSHAQKEQVKLAEGERLLARLDSRDYAVALCIEGKSLSSEQLAQNLACRMAGGQSRVAFIIGGSLGLSPRVLDRADETLSFGPMTFPHQLFRVMLLEQIYRAFRILNNEPYHK